MSRLNGSFVSEMPTIALSVLINAIENKHRFLLFHSPGGDLTFRNIEDYPHWREYAHCMISIDGLRKREILDFCREHRLDLDNDLSMPLRSLGTLPIGALAWKILTDRRRHLLEEAITYYFEHFNDSLPPEPSEGNSFDQLVPRIELIEKKFKIDLYFLRDRLLDIYCAFNETRDLPFAPELNVGIYEFGMFLEEVEEVLRYRGSRIG